jgi:hypothetical protein
MSVTVARLWPQCGHGMGATLIDVSVAVEVAALDILHRAGWQPVTREAVTAWFRPVQASRRLPLLALSGRRESQP